jgi:putative membrane protein
MRKTNPTVPVLLLFTYLTVFAFFALDVSDRATWWVENIPILAVVSILLMTFGLFKFSNFAYFLMTVFLCYHTVGGHYTFELVPFNWGNDWLSLLGFDFIFPEGRNNFDRLGHFLVGVFSYALVEISLKKFWVANRFVAFVFAVFALGFWAASYEIIEMYYAVLEGGKSGAAFLGSQGDIWDAQKDMLMDIFGAMFFGFLALFKHYDKDKNAVHNHFN